MNEQIRRYERHFVWTSLGLFTLALTLAFAVLAVFVQRSNMEHIEVSMRQAARNPPPPSQATGELTGDPPSVDPVTVVTLGRGGELIDVSGDAAPSAADLTAALRAEKSFGALHGEPPVFYCRDLDMAGNTRVAFLGMRDYNRELLHILGPMAVILLAAVLAMLPVFRYLARSASRPLAEALERQRQFSADISHSLKTPLTVILANESLMRRSPDLTETERLGHLDRIRTAGEYMTGLISGMLELAGVASGEGNESRTRLDLSFLTSKACLEMDSLAFERGVALNAAAEDGVFCVGVERYYLRMLTSLVDNALKYEPEGGAVTVRLHTEHRSAVVTVTNHSTRIAEADLPHMFDRFYRGTGAGTASGSFGLGLAIARSMAEDMGGTLSADNDPEAGARLTARLPLSDPR